MHSKENQISSGLGTEKPISIVLTDMVEPSFRTPLLKSCSRSKRRLEIGRMWVSWLNYQLASLIRSLLDIILYHRLTFRPMEYGILIFFSIPRSFAMKVGREAVFVLLVLAVAYLSFVPLVVRVSLAEMAQSHAPILISSNSGFTSENGVTAAPSTISHQLKTILFPLSEEFDSVQFCYILETCFYQGTCFR